MKKKILALLLAALIAMLPIAAMAEPSGMYTVAIMDPQVYMNDDCILDMTGLDLELSLALADNGAIGLVLGLFTGENYDNLALAAQAQIDQNSATAYVNGMSNSYSVDLTSLFGMDISTTLASLALNTAVNSIEIPTITSEDLLSMRQNAVVSLVSAYSTDGAAFSISKEQGAALISENVQTLDSIFDAISTYTGEDLLEGERFADLIAEEDISFELNGSLTASDAGYVLNADGFLYGEGDALPMTISISDFLETTDALLRLENPDNAGESIDLSYTLSNTAFDETRNTVTATLAATYNDAYLFSFDYEVLPTMDSDEVNTYYTLTDSDGEVLQLYYSTGFSSETEVSSFISFGVYNAESDNAEYAIYASYQGSASGEAKDHSGYSMIGLYDGASDTEFTLDMYIYLLAEEEDTADWLLDPAAAVDALSMDEAAMNTAMMGLIGTLSNAATSISENVPGLASIISDLMEDVM